jgi:predicted DNA binding CopG/RHH family protein
LTIRPWKYAQQNSTAIIQKKKRKNNLLANTKKRIQLRVSENIYTPIYKRTNCQHNASELNYQILFKKLVADDVLSYCNLAAGQDYAETAWSGDAT